MSTVINQHGREIEYRAALEIMDDSIREAIHAEFSPCSDQEFYNGYCKAHLQYFGTEFTPDTINGQSCGWTIFDAIVDYGMDHPEYRFNKEQEHLLFKVLTDIIPREYTGGIPKYHLCVIDLPSNILREQYFNRRSEAFDSFRYELREWEKWFDKSSSGDIQFSIWEYDGNSDIGDDPILERCVHAREINGEVVLL